VSVVQADLSDPQTIVPAFQGAEVVYAVTNFYDPKLQEAGTLEEARQGCYMADVAKQTGVKLFIWSTVPSALLRTGAKFDSPRLVENKFTVSQYLKFRDVPHVDLYLGFYMDNYINFGCISRAADGAIEVALPVMKPDTKIGMVWAERDLGQTVLAIITKYGTNQHIFGKSIYCVSGQYSTSDVAHEISKRTGKAVRVVTTPSSGFEDLDTMYQYYNQWGVYREEEISRVLEAELEISFAPLAAFVQNTVVPFIEKL
jgi:uncharacterized protein YbjT (DUF2867 family)